MSRAAKAAGIVIVDLFAGPGGFDEGMRSIGLTAIGIELDEAACATRAAAGHLTIRANVSTYPLERFRGLTGLVASPPCTDFSIAGKRRGLEGDTGRLVYEVMRWAALRPEWIACEQVPGVLPVWRQFRDELRAMGYEAWCGVLDCADYGVPQNRERAFLLASRVGPASPPEPTHAEVPREAGLFGSGRQRWVSMADALGWSGEVQTAQNLGGQIGNYYRRSADAPAPTVITNALRCWKLLHPGRSYGETATRPVSQPAPTVALGHNAASWCWERPATTVMGDRRIAAPGHHSGPMFRDAVKVELHELAVLQGFPPDYPFRGNKTQRAQQIGNAVPPPMAAALIGELTARRRRQAA